MLGYFVNQFVRTFTLIKRNNKFEARHRIDGPARFHTNKAAAMQRHNDFYYLQNYSLSKREIQEMQEKQIRLAAYKDII